MSLGRLLKLALLPVALTICTQGAPAQAPACTANKPGACSKPSFIGTFNAASTVAVVTQPADAMAAGQLTAMLTRLGKTPPPAGTPADLTLSLEEITNAGVMDGPGGVEFAILRVYRPAPGAPTSGGPASDSATGSLIWVEDLVGPADMTWPTAVRSLVLQFQSLVTPKRK